MPDEAPVTIAHLPVRSRAATSLTLCVLRARDLCCCETRGAMLEDFTLATFADRLGDTFRVGEGAGVLDLELVEVSAGVAREGAARVPFAIAFRGPPEPVLP